MKGIIPFFFEVYIISVVHHGMAKGVKDGRRAPALRANLTAVSGVARHLDVEGLGMAGLTDSLRSPCPPLATRPCLQCVILIVKVGIAFSQPRQGSALYTLRVAHLKAGLLYDRRMIFSLSRSLSISPPSDFASVASVAFAQRRVQTLFCFRLTLTFASAKHINDLKRGGGHH
jgi:hypothetical protein